MSVLSDESLLLFLRITPLYIYCTEQIQTGYQKTEPGQILYPRNRKPRVSGVFCLSEASFQKRREQNFCREKSVTEAG